ncbi:hypothetical protein [Kordia sp.]|uniref:hypothetical protein n=1 Tax=Kordia sp. TaxID=1965332 RepID=UPI003B59B91A
MILFFIIGVLSFSLIYLKIPGYGGLCDADQIVFVLVWFVFFVTSVGFMLNSWIFYNKNNWKPYRIFAISVTAALIFLCIFLRQIIMFVQFGNEKYVIEGENFVFVKIQLFENGRFFAKTFDVACDRESVGTYELSKNTLELHFENENPDYLGTTYQIKNSEVICLNCDQDYNLKIK